MPAHPQKPPNTYEQKCPKCERVEAMGGYCTRCLAKTTKADAYVRPRKLERKETE